MEKAACDSTSEADACSCHLIENLGRLNPAQFLRMIDLTDQYRKDGASHAVAGYESVYVDSHHMTADLARTMATGWKVN
jgi:hypothetical protein